MLSLASLPFYKSEDRIELVCYFSTLHVKDQVEISYLKLKKKILLEHHN